MRHRGNIVTCGFFVTDIAVYFSIIKVATEGCEDYRSLLRIVVALTEFIVVALTK
jgi:hypothetical protein